MGSLAGGGQGIVIWLWHFLIRIHCQCVRCCRQGQVLTWFYTIPEGALVVLAVSKPAPLSLLQDVRWVRQEWVTHQQQVAPGVLPDQLQWI